jgi:hypothetical protein
MFESLERRNLLAAAPTDITINSSSVDEELDAPAAVGQFSSVDADGHPQPQFTYSLVAGPGDSGNSKFSILNRQLRTAERFDYEAGQTSFSVRVMTTDPTDLSFETVFTITVNNTNDNAPIITSSSEFNADENQAIAGTVTATDADNLAPLAFSIIGGDDETAFDIDPSTGLLTFVAPPDFEAPGDADGDNVYLVDVQVTDGLFIVSQSISVNVQNVNDNPPIITSGAAFNVNENELSVGTVTATDADNLAPLTFSIIGGDDAASFSINPITGAIAFVQAPDFENPTDLNGDNIYLLEVQVSDGLLSDSQLIAVTVLNLNDSAPVITSNSSFSVPENTTAVATVTATDADSLGPLTFSIVGGTDVGAFSIDSSSGALSFLAAPDFEAPIDHDGDNIYQVEVEVSDGANATTQMITVTVLNVNDNAPAFTSGTAFNVNEHDTDVAVVAATDADGDSITYSIDPASVDATLFSIDPLTGALTFLSPPDFENPADFGSDNVYDIDVQAFDGIHTTSKSLTITVVDQNDAPILNSSIVPAMSVINEDNFISWGTPVWVLLAGTTDPDAGAVRGVAVVGADTANGSWEFTLDGGGSWNALGVVSSGSARLIPASGNLTRIRFVPNPNFHGEVQLQFHAWDQTEGTAGGVKNLLGAGATGGSSAFSTDVGTAVLNVAAVNDAPVLNTSVVAPLTSIKEDNFNSWGTPVWMIAAAITDVDGDPRGLAITSLSTGVGTWQYTLNGGTTWTNMGTVSLSSALLLPSNGNESRVRFVPAPNFNGTVQIGYYAWDQTEGSAGTNRDISAPGSRGGSSAFSHGFRTSSLEVEPVNDAPVLNTSVVAPLTSIAKNNVNSYGTPVWMIAAGITDVDADAKRGIAISVASTSNGFWQYTLNDGATWSNLPAVSFSNAFLLPVDGNNSRVRFVPNANFTGTALIGYYAWDQTQGTVAGATVDLTGKLGGTNPFSAQFRTSSISVV